MNCPRVVKLYDAYRRGLLSERGNRQLEEHLANCSGCREVFEENEMLVTLVNEASEPPEAPPQYYQRLAARTIERLATPPSLMERLGESLRRVRYAMQWRPLLQYATVGAICLFVGFASSSFRDAPAGLTEQSVPVSPVVFIPPETNNEVTANDYQSPNLALFDTSTGARDISPDSISKSMIGNQENDSLQQNPPIYLLSVDPGSLTALGNALGANFLKAIAANQQPSGQPTIVDPPIVEVKNSPPAMEWAPTLNQIQQLKLELYKDGSLDQVRKIREIESAISAAQGDAAQQSALADYHQAEDAFLARNYGPAMKLYRQVVMQEPNSMLAALSRLQMANIRFELQDYANAFREYKECIDDKKYFTQDKHDWIMQRAQLLVDNDADDYRPLRLFMLAEQSNGTTALTAYQQLLEEYPSGALAPEAIKRLRQLAIYGDGADRIPISSQRAISILQRFVLQTENKTAAANAQLAIGDITRFRLQNIQQARLEYSRLFEMTEDEELLKQVRERLK